VPAHLKATHPIKTVWQAQSAAVAAAGAVVEDESNSPLADHNRLALPPAPLPKVLALEAGSAWLSALLVAPFISIVDKSIIANASGRQPLVAGLKEGLKTLLTRPTYFVRQPAFLLIW
jgi:hypothetical protein